jgi:hypothetical protein
VGVKLPENKSDHSPPSSAEVENTWSYTFIPPYAFMAWCLIKHRGSTFTLLLNFKLCVLINRISFYKLASHFGRFGMETKIKFK